jgi:hypothetical protein
VGREPAAVRVQGCLLEGISCRPLTKVALVRSFTRHEYLNKWYRQEEAEWGGIGRADGIKTIPSISRETKWKREVQF